jgi:hypothetical protein
MTMISAEVMKQAAINGSMKPPSDHVTPIVNAQYRAASAAATSAAPRIGVRIGDFANFASGFGAQRDSRKGGDCFFQESRSEFSSDDCPSSEVKRDFVLHVSRRRARFSFGHSR